MATVITKMSSLLPPGRLETRQVYAVHQQQRQQQSVGANGGTRELIMRAANSRRRYVPQKAALVHTLVLRYLDNSASV